MNTIFTQMAAYRDPQLIPTLLHMISNCHYPHNNRVVVCWQHGIDQPLSEFMDNGFKHHITSLNEVSEFSVHYLEKDGTKIELIDVDYFKSKGACWARNLIQQFYNDEKYTLQLDSHHRFVKHWDDVCIDMIEELRLVSPKPLITAYIPSFDPDNDPDGRVQEPWKMNFDRFIPEGTAFTIPSSFTVKERELNRPLRSRFYSAHFAFADGIFAKEVQHDPELFFHGEELSITVRAFTHGYDIYCPHKIIAWHEYTRKNRTKVWDDATTQNKNKGLVDLDWVERNNSSHARNRILFGMDGCDKNSINFGKYGFGNVRTVREYEEYAGISFDFRGVTQETLDQTEPPNSLKYENDEQWKNSFVRSNDIRVCFHKNELGNWENDYDFWYVGCHDENGNEIFRKDAQRTEIIEYGKHEFLDFRLIFLSNIKPATYTVWTHSKSKGWLTKVDKIVTEH